MEARYCLKKPPIHLVYCAGGIFFVLLRLKTMFKALPFLQVPSSQGKKPALYHNNLIESVAASFFYSDSPSPIIAGSFV